MNKHVKIVGVVSVAMVVIGWWLWSRSPMPTAIASSGEERSVAGAGALTQRPEEGQASAAFSGDAGDGEPVVILHGGVLAGLAVDQVVHLPAVDGRHLKGMVQVVDSTDDGVTRVAGTLLDGEPGTFVLGGSDNELAGRVLMPGRRLAWQIVAAGSRNLDITELPLPAVFCHPMPRPSAEQVGVPALSSMETPPVLSSRPDATAVLYLDFDGETVNDPDWIVFNGGQPIVAAPSPLGRYQIREVWERVREDFRAFNVDVTTDGSRYAQAPVGRRMRVIITPTRGWIGDVGGVAYVDSFAMAGTAFFSSTIPCWVFNPTPSTIAEAVSHELGHTLGLRHDGDLSQPAGSAEREYYAGHGSGAVSWGPIMGAPYYKALSQWSRGEYANANNLEDDLAILSGERPTPLTGAMNLTGYVPDDAGGHRAAAAPLSISNGQIFQEGAISSAGDEDYYVFSLSLPSTVSLIAMPANPGPNVDLAVELQDQGGNVLVAASPDDRPEASWVQVVPAGTYFVRVRGVGRGNVLADGYSNYGSVGHYTLQGSTVSTVVAPSIVVHPPDRYINAGGYATFSVVASGTAPLRYQWQKYESTVGWVDLEPGETYSGTNTDTLMVNYIPNTSSSGTFRCVVRNLAGSAASLVGDLTYAPRPIITGHPKGLLAQAGGTATFQVRASVLSGPAPTYRWRKDGVDLVENDRITGVNHWILNITDVQAEDAGSYSVVVRNTEVPGAISAAAALVVPLPPPPVIVARPIDLEVAQGGTARFSVGAAGGPPLRYAWWKATEPSVLLGDNSAQLILSDVQPEDEGLYCVRVSNAAGAVEATAYLAVGAVPRIGVQPTSQVVALGSGALFSVSANGGLPPTYQWYRNGSPIPGATASVLQIASVTEEDVGEHWVVVSNRWGSTISARAMLSLGSGPVIVEQPQPTTVTEGETLRLSVGARSTVPLTYQWFRNGFPVSGSGATLQIDNVRLEDAGLYSVTVMSSLGKADSDQVVVTVEPGRGKPEIIRQPTPAISLPPGGAFGTGVVAAAKDGPFTYQWFKNGQPMADQTTDFLFINGVQVSDAGQYVLRVGNAQGFTESRPLRLWVTSNPGAPNVTISPQTVFAGTPGSATLSASVTGTGPFTYQWYRDGEPIPGATGATYEIPSPSDFVLSQFSVVATNAIGAATSGYSQIWPGTPPAPLQITRQPESRTVVAGSTATFAVEAAGAFPLSYAWFHNGRLVPGALPTLTLENVDATHSGEYHVRVANVINDVVTSITVRLDVVSDLPAITSNTTVNATVGQSMDYQIQTADATEWYGFEWTSPVQGAAAFNATTGTLTLTPGEPGTYTFAVFASNLLGADRREITLHVAGGETSPMITHQPGDRIGELGGETSFVIQATGGNLQFQWRKDGHALTDGAQVTGATSSVLRLIGLGRADSGNYDVVIHNPAGTVTSAQARLQVLGRPQSIDFAPLDDRLYSDSPIPLVASATSELPVAFALVSGPALLSGGVLTLQGGGLVTVRASQAGNVEFDPAPVVERSFSVSKLTASLALDGLGATYDGASKQVLATTQPAGLAVTIAYNGSRALPIDAGDYVVAAVVDDRIYQAALIDMLRIAKADQTIVFPALPDRSLTAEAIPLVASTSSGMPVSFSIQAGPAAITANSLRLEGKGVVTVRATQAGNHNFNAAPYIEHSFTVTDAAAGFSAWRNLKFSIAELADVTISGPNADPDGDGYSNFLEYALGLEPNNPDSIGLPEVGATATELTYTYARPADRADVTYAVEVSHDLVTWTTEGVAHAFLAAVGDEKEAWQAKYPLAGANNIFFRLRATGQ